MASHGVEKALDALNDHLTDLGKTSHHHPSDYGKAVDAFIDLVDRGETVHADDVRHWAIGRGWEDRAAHDLAEMADAVVHTMRSLQRRGRLRPFPVS